MIRLRDLLQGGALSEIRPGVWVEARPMPEPYMRHRLRDAWAVLMGRADALSWPNAEDPTTWCAVDCRGMSHTPERGQHVKEWIAVSEKMPEPWQRVLLAFKTQGFPGIEIGSRSDNYGWVDWMHGRPTHWMHLPAHPEAEGQP